MREPGERGHFDFWLIRHLKSEPGSATYGPSSRWPAPAVDLV